MMRRVDSDAGEGGRAEDRAFLKKIRIMHERDELAQSEGGAVSLREVVRLSDGAFLMENNKQKKALHLRRKTTPLPPQAPQSSKEPGADGAELLEPVH